MHLVEGFTLRNVLDEWIAVPSGDSAMRMQGLLSFNETGAFLFTMLREEQTVETMISNLLENYEIDEETAKGDVLRFLERLRSKNLLVEDAE